MTRHAGTVQPDQSCFLESPSSIMPAKLDTLKTKLSPKPKEGSEEQLDCVYSLNETWPQNNKVNANWYSTIDNISAKEQRQ